MPDIETLDLSVKSYAVIKRMGINTTEELKDRIEDVLLHTQKAGEEAIEKLNALSVVSTEQRKQAYELHYRIISSADTAQSALWDMCKNLKEMRDSKLYKALGYQNFEDYCENEVGIKRSCAYKYISIIENVHLENVHTYGQIGTSKLALLATISEEQQHELSEKVNLEETTVKQLKAEIDKLKNHNRDLGAAKDKAVAALTSLEEKVSTLKEEKNIINNYKNKLEKDLEAKSEMIADTVEREKRVAEKLKEQKLENARLERENEELRSRPVEVAVVDNSAENDRKLNEVIRSLERENMKRNEEMDRQYIEDRRQLEADKQREINAIRDEYEKKLAESVKAAEPSPEPIDADKLKFKVYLTAAFDSLKRLTDFTQKNQDDTYKEKIKQLLNSVLAELED